uniref:Sodium hydrogen exchanger n=1 Tax=Tetraselmis sp. GSL018 TaxID=582737 RepID=A0A061RDT3_9CHLO
MHSFGTETLWYLAQAATLSPFAVIAGNISQKLRLPRITGFLLTGIVCGPYVLKLLTEKAVRAVWPVDYVCLSVIAVAAGSELQISELHRTKSQVFNLCFGICFFSYVFVYATMYFLAPFVNHLEGLTDLQLHAFCSLAGCLMMARSPASAIAVLKEMDARGPFTSLVMAVVVVKDVVVIMAFALNMEVARVVFSKDAGTQMTAAGLLEPILSITASLTMGIGGAVILGTVLRAKNGLLHGLLGQTAGRRLQGAAAVVVTTALFTFAELAKGEPLLACVVMGLVATNRRHHTGEREREELHHILGGVMPMTNVPFFALAGASLKMTALVGTLWLAAVVYCVRLGSIWAGSLLGAGMAGCPREHRNLFWLSMVTQAGVAMGLAKTCAVRFPGWGDDYVTLMAGVIMLNLLTGPPMFKSSLVMLGEARTVPNIMGSHEVDAEYEGEARTSIPAQNHETEASSSAYKDGGFKKEERYL